jgi:lipopolysaccharide export LptBFGC system permease protein LptF
MTNSPQPRGKAGCIGGALLILALGFVVIGRVFGEQGDLSARSVFFGAAVVAAAVGAWMFFGKGRLS